MSEWEDAPEKKKKRDEWEDAPSLSSESMDRFGRGAINTLLSGVELVGSIPGAVAAAVGAGGSLLAGQGIKDSLKAGHEIMGATTPSGIVENAGRLMGSKDTVDAVKNFRQSGPYHELIERPFGALTMGARDLGSAGARVGGAMYEGQETGADVGELALILAALGAFRGGRKPSVKEIEIAKDEMARRQRERDVADKWEDAPVGTQMEIPMPQQSPYRGTHEGMRQSTPVPQMMERMNERMADEQAARQDPQQASLFEPAPREEFPGIARSEELQRQKEAVPYELGLEEPNNLGRPEKLPPFREGDLDMPLKYESFENDPYWKTLKDEFDKHMTDYQRNQFNKERADAYGQTKRYAQSTKEQRDRYDRNATKALEKANEALANADKVWQEADGYYKKRVQELGIESPDHYRATMWERPAKGAIEKTPSTGIWRPGHKQGGTVDIRLKEVQKAIDELDKRIKNLERARDTSESGESAAKIDDRLQRLYFDAMKLQNAKLALADPKHPHHKFWLEKGLNTGPMGRQKGTIEIDRKLRNKLRVNPEGLDFGGYEALPDNLKEWVIGLAHDRAIDRLVESGVEEKGINVRKLTPEEQAEFGKHFNEALNNPDFIKQAIRDSLGKDPHLSPFEWHEQLGSKGKYGRQKGTVDFTDPEFLKFKDELERKGLGQYAKGAWREVKKMEKARIKSHYGNQPVVKQDHTLKTIDEVPGLKTWKDYILPILKSPEELKPVVLKEPDLPKGAFNELGRQMVSGAKILGMATQNTLVRYAAQGTDRVMRNSQEFIENKLLHKNQGVKPLWEKLNREEQGHLWTELVAREGFENLTREQMFDLGFSEKQVNAGEALRKALDSTYRLLNDGRAAQGRQPIEKRPGYIPSRFRGDYVVHVRDAEGKLVHVMGANTKFGAQKLKEWLEARPEAQSLKIEEPMHEPIHRFKDASDAQAGYQALIDVLAKEDPLVAALEQAYAKFLDKQSYDTMGIKKHFREKVGVKGGEGFKEWKDAYENAQEGLRSIMNYIDHATKWSYAQMELKNVRQLLKDKEIQKAQPTTVSYVQAYLDQALGRSTKLARSLDVAFDYLANHTGIGQSLMLKGIRDVKYFLTAKYLGFLNAGFSLSQIMQVVQTQPALMQMIKGKGAEGSIWMAYARGNMDAIYGFMGKWVPSMKENMTVLSRQAWEYAQDKGIVEPKILDDARSWKDAKISKALDEIATWNMTAFEKIARTQAYMTWVHFLHESGMKMGKELYEAAGQMTDITMVDYRNHERPMLYKQMGIIGETANALTTFKHNYYSQAWMLRKLADGDLRPEMTFYATLLLLGGLLSLPMREDVDVLIGWLNKMLPERIPTTREMLLKLPELVSFGPTSSLSGLDVTSKFSAANVIPEDAITAAFPFAGTIADIGQAAYGFAKDPSVTSAMRLAQQVAPSSSQKLHEDYFKKNGITLNPNSLEGQHRRTPFDEKARLGAVRSMPESRNMHTARTWREQDAWFADSRSSIIKKAKDRAFEGNYMALSELARKYIEKEGKPNDFVDQVLENVKEQHRTQVERMLMQSMNNPMKLRRRMGAR